MYTHRILQTVYMSSVWIERTACNPSRPFQLDPTLPSPPITSNPSCFVPKLRFAVACLVIQTCLCPPLVIQTQLSLYLDAPSDGLALILPLFVCFATRLLCPVCLLALAGFYAFCIFCFYVFLTQYMDILFPPQFLDLSSSSIQPQLPNYTNVLCIVSIEAVAVLLFDFSNIS